MRAAGDELVRHVDEGAPHARVGELRDDLAGLTAPGSAWDQAREAYVVDQLEHLGELRRFGGQLEVAGTDRAARILNDAARYLPADWVEAAGRRGPVPITEAGPARQPSAAALDHGPIKPAALVERERRPRVRSDRTREYEAGSDGRWTSTDFEWVDQAQPYARLGGGRVVIGGASDHHPWQIAEDSFGTYHRRPRFITEPLDGSTVRIPVEMNMANEKVLGSLTQYVTGSVPGIARAETAYFERVLAREPAVASADGPLRPMGVPDAGMGRGRGLLAVALPLLLLGASKGLR